MPQVLRVEEINIGMPKPGADPFVSITLQSVGVDEEGNVVSISGRSDIESAPATKTATEVVQVDDPVLGQKVTISGAALNEAVLMMILAYLARARGLEIVPPGYLKEP